MTLAGFPHSGTPGSTPTCGSPRLFAACRALLRLSVPRHPPCALVRLTGYPRTRIAARGSYPAHRSFLQTHTLVLASSLDAYLTNFPIPVFSMQSGWGSACSERSTCEDFLLPRESTRRSRKEVIQPQVPLRLPCYDFAPVTELAFGGSLPCGLGHRLRALPTPMA